ncbi:DUF882 domain-containing protein [Pseudomonas sp. R2.Fl]|nr:DUF882 domain-containing protein [Pseudomonas sp. R2.Fl]
MTYRVALACLLAFATISQPAIAEETKKRKATFFMKHSYSAAYTVQRASVQVSCFPEKLQRILAHIASETGHRPMVTSGHRPRSGRSQHSRCFAADIRVPGVSERRIVAAAKRAPGIGGVGRYCNGIVHVDIGPRRNWVYC